MVENKNNCELTWMIIIYQPLSLGSICCFFTFTSSRSLSFLLSLMHNNSVSILQWHLHTLIMKCKLIIRAITKFGCKFRVAFKRGSEYFRMHFIQLVEVVAVSVIEYRHTTLKTCLVVPVTKMKVKHHYGGKYPNRFANLIAANLAFKRRKRW